MCFEGESYFEIAKLLLLTLDKFIVRKDVDILIRTDENTHPLVSNWIQDVGTKVFINTDIRYYLEISYQPMYVQRFVLSPLFAKYDKVLYLDTDILISNYNINTLFDEPIADGILYVVQETNDFNRSEWSNKHYTDEDIELMAKHNVYPFNNGQFLFKYTDTMATHFKNVIQLIESTQHNSFIDQQCMNQYFNERLISRCCVLDKYTQLFAAESFTTNGDKCIMHFCGNIHDGEWKLEVMTKCFSSTIEV